MTQPDEVIIYDTDGGHCHHVATPQTKGNKRMKALRTLTITTMIMTLVACSTPDFEDEAQKQELFDAYICDQTLQASESLQKSYATQAAIDVLADENASTQERKIALSMSMASMGHGAGYDGPPLTTTPDGKSCYGWVWDHYIEKQRASEEYDTFTWKQAEEAGVIDDE